MTEQFFICGCIRSGTSFFCDMFTDFVQEIYNECGDINVINRKKTLADNCFAMKWCEDYNNKREIFEHFPRSKIILVVRDLRDTLNSIYNPNAKSIPFRNFPAVEQISVNQNVSYFEAGLIILNQYYDDISKNALDEDEIEIVIYDDICKHPQQLKDIFDKLFPNNIKDIIYYKNKILKTPNQLSYLNWTEAQKTQFKTFNNGFLNKMLLHFNFENTEDW